MILNVYNLIYYPDHDGDPAQEMRNQVERNFEPHQLSLNREWIVGSKQALPSVLSPPPAQGHTLHLPCSQGMFPTAVPDPCGAPVLAGRPWDLGPMMKESTINWCQAPLRIPPAVSHPN